MINNIFDQEMIVIQYHDTCYMIQRPCIIEKPFLKLYDDALFWNISVKISRYILFFILNISIGKTCKFPWWMEKGFSLLNNSSKVEFLSLRVIFNVLSWIEWFCYLIFYGTSRSMGIYQIEMLYMISFSSYIYGDSYNPRS